MKLRATQLKPKPGMKLWHCLTCAHTNTHTDSRFKTYPNALQPSLNKNIIIMLVYPNALQPSFYKNTHTPCLWECRPVRLPAEQPLNYGGPLQQPISVAVPMVLIIQTTLIMTTTQTHAVITLAAHKHILFLFIVTLHVYNAKQHVIHNCCYRAYSYSLIHNISKDENRMCWWLKWMIQRGMVDSHLAIHMSYS